MKGQCGIQGAGDGEAVHCEQPLQPAQPHRTSHSCVLKGQCWRQVSAATCVARIRRGARAQRAMSPGTSEDFVRLVKDRADLHIGKASRNLSDYLLCASRIIWGRAGVTLTQLLFVPPCGYPAPPRFLRLRTGAASITLSYLLFSLLTSYRGESDTAHHPHPPNRNTHSLSLSKPPAQPEKIIPIGVSSVS